MERNASIGSFAQFWPVYVRAHSKPLTQWLHALGSCSGTGFFAWCLFQRNWALLPLSFVIGYGIVWFSHLVSERNIPATLGGTIWHVVWSFLADWRMVYLLFRGRMTAEVARHTQN